MRRVGPDGQQLSPDVFVFGNEFGESVKYWRVREAWNATCATAEIHGLNFHDLRRIAASTLRASGVPDHVVREWLGHADISTTSRYLKASRTERQKYVKQFEQQRTTPKRTGKKRGGSHTIRTNATPTASGDAAAIGSKLLN